MDGEEELKRLREEVGRLRSEVKARQALPASEVLAALKQSSETDGVPAAFLESLTGMVRQMGPRTRPP